jgi:16S rRNA (cytosine967-C5)-methyltransferase
VSIPFAVVPMNPTDTSGLILSTCAAILGQGRHADAALQNAFRKHPDLPLVEKSYIATTVYDIVRYARWLAALTTGDPAAPMAVSPVLLAAWQLWRGVRTPENPHEQEILARAEKFAPLRSLRESVPDWLDASGEKECGALWDTRLAALNQPAQQVLRANTLKTSPEALAAAVTAYGYTCRRIDWAPDALLLDRYAPVFHWDEFKKGWFELQDAASQAVAVFLEVKPGMRVIDGCAGRGGKTLHLAALMRNRGKIIALDVDSRKLIELERRSRRAGCSIIESRPITSSKTVKRLAGSADRLLLDVPCSGTGVWRRNPDGKWHLQPEELSRLRAGQQHLLTFYSRMVKPGGRLVYATCSVFPSEGEEQVARFLATSDRPFKLAGQQRLDPDTHGFDGFYMAALEVS